MPTTREHQILTEVAKSSFISQKDKNETFESDLIVVNQLYERGYIGPPFRQPSVKAGKSDVAMVRVVFLTEKGRLYLEQLKKQ